MCGEYGVVSAVVDAFSNCKVYSDCIFLSESKITDFLSESAKSESRETLVVSDISLKLLVTGPAQRCVQSNKRKPKTHCIRVLCCHAFKGYP